MGDEAPKPPKTRLIRRAEPERLTHLARGVVRGDYLVVDMKAHPEWGMSLAFIAEGIMNVRNLGMILVPVASHQKGYWINGAVPGVTLECVLVAKGDLPDLRRRIKKMNDALFPDE